MKSNDTTRDNARVVGRVRSEKLEEPPVSEVSRETLAEPGAALPPLIPRRPKRGPPTRETMDAITAELQDAVRRLDALDRAPLAEGEDDGEAF